MITFTIIQITAYPGESIKLVIISLDELYHPTSDNIQIQELLKINVRMCFYKIVFFVGVVYVCVSIVWENYH